MRLVIIRVKSAAVDIDGERYSEIGEGLLALVGIREDDTMADVEYIARKLPKLRIFEDEEGKLNRSVLDIGGEVMLISNFTLYGDTFHGHRPNFSLAARGDVSQPLYDALCAAVGEHLPVKTGVFGADMKVSSLNDGPVTIIMESRK